MPPGSETYMRYVKRHQSGVFTRSQLSYVLDDPHRVAARDATTQVLMRRLLSLDYIIERPTLRWLPTEDEPVPEPRCTATVVDVVAVAW